MKRIFFVILLTTLCGSPSFAAFYDVREAISSLQSLNLDQLPSATEEIKLSEAELKAQDVVFESLEKAVTVALKESPSEDLQGEILRVALVLLKKDPSQFAGEVILPLYEKDKKSFMNGLKKLSAEDSELIEEAVKAAAREKKSGNG